MPNRRLIRNHTTLFQSTQWICHALANWLVLAAAALSTESGFSADYRLFGLLTIAGFSAAAHFVGYYRRFVVGWLCVWRVAEVWALTVGIMLVVTLITNTSHQFDPKLLMQMVLLGFVSHLSIYLGFRTLSNFWHENLKVNIRSIMIGSGTVARRVITAINRNSFLPDKIVGVVDSTEGPEHWNDIGLPVMGNIERIGSIIKSNDISRVYLAYPISRSEELQELQNILMKYPVDVIWIPDLSALNLLNPSIRELGGMPFVSLMEGPLASGPKAYVKTLMDFCIAICLLVVLSPVFLIIAASVKLSSSGPVFYKQRRHGWNEKEFEIWKFRSMAMHDESEGIKQAQREDPRITPIGKILRRTSLDELPQLINVVNGTMSLVGPRPHAVEHNNMYTARLKKYMTRHRIKPGMTGWAQVHGHRGETDTLLKMQNRLTHDLYYINNWGLKLDLLILIRTPLALLTSNAR